MRDKAGTGGNACTRIAGFGRRCRDAGLADTPQRRMIFQRLAESTDHPTAETVFLRVKPDIPGMSLATVYRNLKLFFEAGLIDEVATGRSLARYDANQEPHHHLICRDCACVDDYFDDSFDCMAAVGSAGGKGGFIGGFEVHDARLTVYGVCERCRAGKSGDNAKQN